MNNQPPRRGGQRRQFPSRRPTPVDVWRTAEPLPDLEPIRMSLDLGALLRSLGEPPMHDGTTAGHYFERVIERAAGVAFALAISANVLAEQPT